ncbi:hypothetical protein [Massilia endophytica]|uniref:hypothetical protein n=1 Tax=Massilia endophytica TaxID=2899220 RepID=UPI001E45342B|nr:hypothetical protein [Massilia endophytica]UGQ46712.1 hypothetical protein LSQ66_23590 [Massilia endophytica]
MRTRALLMSASLLLAGLAFNPSAQAASVVQEFLKRYGELAQSMDIGVDEYCRKSLATMSQLQPQSMATGDLAQLFKALYIVASYVPGRQAAERLEAAADELARRGKLTSEDGARVLQAFAAAHLGEHLERFKRRHGLASDVLALPASEGVDRALHVAKDSGLSMQSFAFPKGGYVLVVGHPQCHFTPRAASDLAQNAALADTLQRYSTWVIPQTGDLTLKLWHDWNKDHPKFPMSVLHQNSQWPELDTKETPVFYFFKDGVLKRTLHGWRGPQRIPDIIEALAEVGIASASAAANR